MRGAPRLARRCKYTMRYYEICEEVTPAERARRDSEKRRKANAKRDAARKRKVDAARDYQDALRRSNEAIQTASNAATTIGPS